MRTTLDLPAPLIKRLKRRAVQEGVPIKTVYNRALARAFGVTYLAPRAKNAAAGKTPN
jgi:hypothetical protein